ncbi:MAG: DNA repair protein RecO [Oscillospiraceae bacterium]|nr:DNA repair protein RecO [Oscillospiraceae bacterium]
MTVKTTGLILKQRNLGESDRVFTVLSENFGIIEAIAGNINRLKNNPAASIIQFGYYDFELFSGKQRYYIKTPRLIEGFISLSEDLRFVALAGYFCELLITLTVPAQGAKEFLRLALNTLHYLSTGKKPPEPLKSIFELRAVSLGGFQPDLVGCTYCRKYESDGFRFSFPDGSLCCSDCEPSGERAQSEQVILTMPILSVMRHIVYSELEKLFTIPKITPGEMKTLNKITQQYTLLHTLGEFNSLNMYNEIS